MPKSFWATNDELAVKAWNERLFRQIIIEPFFASMMSEKGDMPVYVKPELSKGPGDKVTFGIINKLTGKGKESTDSDFILRGSEESLDTNADSLTLKEIGHSVKGRNPMSQQRVFFSIDVEAETAIKNWGVEKIDQMIFDAIYATAFTKEFNGGGVANTGLLTVADKLTPAVLMKAHAWAKTGGSRSQNPLEPIRINGKRYLVALLHPYTLFDLKMDSTFQQWMREAEARGKENPLFTGSVALCDGLIIKSHERIETGLGGVGANVLYSKNLLLGARAVGWAWGKEKLHVESEAWDFKRHKSYGIMGVAGAKKIIFDSKDYGVVGLNCAMTDVDA